VRSVVLPDTLVNSKLVLGVSPNVPFQTPDLAGVPVEEEMVKTNVLPGSEAARCRLQ